MDNNHFIFKVSRLLPSSFTSCQSRTLPDVAENCKIPNENDLSLSSSFTKSSNPKNIPPISSSLPKRSLISSHAQGRKCPPKLHEKKNWNPLFSVNHSSSSNSAWFTSGDDVEIETETFFSISSNSGDSFRLKSGRMFRKCEEMKSIDETGRRSFSSVDTVLSKCGRGIAAKTAAKGGRRSGKTWPEFELGSDHISTQMYYGNKGDAEANVRRRRKTKKKRGSMRRSLDCRSVIGESYAVEKRSSDPGGDFRASMVEMILEKQIFAAEDLERLLHCYLSLNVVSYHGIIFHVFSEICQTLFRN